MPQLRCGSPRTTLFFPSTFMWVLEIEFRLSSLHSKCFILSHLGYLLFVWVRDSLYYTSWPWTCCADQADFKLTMRPGLAPNSQRSTSLWVLGLKGVPPNSVCYLFVTGSWYIAQSGIELRVFLILLSVGYIDIPPWILADILQIFHLCFWQLLLCRFHLIWFLTFFWCFNMVLVAS